MKNRRWRLWALAAGALLVAAGAAAAWRWTPLKDVLSPSVLAQWVGAYRHHWLACPFTVGVFVLAEFLFFPVLLLVLFTGIVFGPWLGSAYALAGCMASAAAGYGAGHLLGPRRLERWGGRRVKTISEKMGKKGVMVVFLARKVPAPYTLVNLVAGASRIRFVDFMLGTLLGMGTGVVALAVFGDQMSTLWTSPSWPRIALAAGLFFVPVVVAVGIQRLLKRRSTSLA
jgi:phospholipase D1/2